MNNYKEYEKSVRELEATYTNLLDALNELEVALGDMKTSIDTLMNSAAFIDWDAYNDTKNETTRNGD